MSVPMQLVKQNTQPQQRESRVKVSDLISLEMTPEEQWNSTLDYIFRLQAEVKALKHELNQARRALAMKDVLLKNYLRREQELRTQLVEGRY